MTGRILYHYTTRAMTGKTPELMEIEGKSFIEMNIVDADKLGIKNGDKSEFLPDEDPLNLPHV